MQSERFNFRRGVGGQPHERMSAQSQIGEGTPAGVEDASEGVFPRGG